MKNEIREQLRLLAQQIIEKDSFQATEIKETALEIYNKSAVLEFLENQEEKPIHGDIEDVADDKILQEETSTENPESLSLKTEDSLTHVAEDIQEDKPDTENKNIETQEEPTSKPVINELELFASEFQNMPEFERKVPQTPSNTETPSHTEKKNNIHQKLEASKPKSLNDTINQGLHIGLNDRLAFINHLFEGQTEDYTRVLSQINTLHSFEEAKVFIEDQVKPDYNNWQNKDEFSDRFMVIIEKTFS